MIAVVDYGMGNIRSVLNALEAIGAAAELVSDASKLGGAERIILPGVGAFGDGMRRLDEQGFTEALPGRVLAGTPLLGICLGMQLLGARSFEHGEHSGLGLMAGEVRRLEPGNDLRVPHIGWNLVERQGTSRLLGDEPDPTFYFVHSFELHPEGSVVTGTAPYGSPVTAVVEDGHVLGCQFHPEKSQYDGLALLRRFVGL
jgi:glutamine amidotransferase